MDKKTATLVESSVDTTKGAEVLAHEATENITIIVNVPKLTYERVMSHKLRDVLPFVPAIKRDTVVQSKLNEMFSKYFESALNSMENSATIKTLKAQNPELFKKTSK